ncbi:MAG TPA: hypothetical protein VH917_06505 [Ignavibacteriaceae bacterium]|jgi:outer membrane protein
MKSIKLFIWLIVIGIVCALPMNSALAQKWYGAATYQVSMPFGDTKEFTDEISWLGWGLEYRSTMDKNSTLGVMFGWNVFHERTSETAQFEGEIPGAISGTQDRYINSFPIMASAHYYFLEKGSPRPFVGLNAGGAYTMQRFAIGVSLIDTDRWVWGVAPEAGVIFPVDREFGIMLNARYNYYFPVEGPLGRDISHNYLGIGIGFIWLSN